MKKTLVFYDPNPSPRQSPSFSIDPLQYSNKVYIHQIFTSPKREIMTIMRDKESGARENIAIY